MPTQDKIPYDKPFLDYEEQLLLLQERGLIIDDAEKAMHLLAKISYYRLSGYWYPLLADKEKHTFKIGANFDDAFRLYLFDKELRKLFLSELEKIEIAIRAQIIYILSEYKGGFWIEDATLFPNNAGHSELMNSVQKEYQRSDEKFIDAFRLKYSNPLPPSWMLLEITSFGTLSTIYKHLKPGRSKRRIASAFGLDDTSLESWLHSMVYVRNLCAHHCRLWNRELSIRPNKLHSPKNIWLNKTDISNSRIFYFASVIVYLLNSIDPTHNFKTKFINLIRRYDNIDHNRMGFPDEWEKEPLWKCDE